jgi:hypothetical protein
MSKFTDNLNKDTYLYKHSNNIHPYENKRETWGDIIGLQFSAYEGLANIFWTDAVKVIKLTVRHIGPHHPRSSSLPLVDTGLAVTIFGTLPRSRFLSECQALSAIRPVVSNRHPFSFNFIFGNRKNSQGAKLGVYGGWGMIAISCFARNCWVRMEV